jgi:RNA polymerase sigma factor (sigma-70 family)
VILDTDQLCRFERRFPTLMLIAFNVGCRFFRGNRDAAEDVAQETMTRAYVRWTTVSAHPKLEAWVATTALYVAFEMSRRDRASRTPVPIPADEANGETRILAADQVERVLRRLSPRQRDVVIWRFYFDYSVAETAEILGITESKVKDATHEATSKFAKLKAIGRRTETVGSLPEQFDATQV